MSIPEGGFAKVSVSASQTRSQGIDGENTVTLDITRSAAAGLSGEGELGAFKAGAGAFAGEEIYYSVTVPEGHYNDVLAGRAPFPDPGDLSTLPPGSRVVIRQEGLRGGSQTVKRGVFQIGADGTTARGRAVSLEVANSGTVRVLAGPTDAVASGTSVGLGGSIGPEGRQLSGSIALSGSKSLRNATLSFVDLDRNTGAAAYEEFIRTGAIPPSGTAGVRTAGTVNQQLGNERIGVGVTAGFGNTEGTSPKLVGRDLHGTKTHVAYNDGRRQKTFAASEGDATYFTTTAFDASGKQTSHRSGLLLDNLAGSGSGKLIATAFGKPFEEDETYQAQIELTQAEYTEIRNRRLDELGRGTGMSDADIDVLRAGADRDGRFRRPVRDRAFVPPRGVDRALINNTDVDQFLAHADLRSSDSGFIAELFALTHAGTGVPLPGTVQLRKKDR